MGPPEAEDGGVEGGHHEEEGEDGEVGEEARGAPEGS